MKERLPLPIPIPEYWSLKHNIKDKNCLTILNKAKMALANLAEEAGKK